MHTTRVASWYYEYAYNEFLLYAYAYYVVYSRVHYAYIYYAYYCRSKQQLVLGSRCTYQLVQQLRVCSYSPVTTVAVSIGAMATNTSLPTTSVLPITFKYSIYRFWWDMLVSSKGREKINLQINSDYELLFTYLQPLEKVNSLRPQSLVISQW